MTPRVCVGTKRGRNYGLVYAPDGTVIGRVHRESKTARRALGGGRRSFWTANAILDGIEAGYSLGTRHVTRRDAVNAILAFHASYPRDNIINVALALWNRGNDATRAMRCALGCAASQFKYDHWQTCGLSQRNLSDPRLSRWHTPVPEAR